MRVGIIGLQHESNTFLPTPTTIEHFRRGDLREDPSIREVFAAAHHEIGGFFAGLEEADIEAVPVFVARATPSGTVTADAYAEILDRMLSALHRAGKLDGLLVAPHGAGVSQSHRDMDGHWLGVLRSRLGAEFPMIGTLDPHANVSPAMVAACQGLIAYRSNPHLDQRQRGVEAARLMARTLRGEIRPVLAASLPPVSINIERQLTSASPCRELYAKADEILTRPGVLSNSIILGFPYADCEELGSGFLVIADGDAGLAQRCADELGNELWRRREEFVGRLVTIDDAVRYAATAKGPVGLLDMGDNVGGGSPADATLLLHAVVRAGITNALACLFDAPSVEQARAAGVGSRITLSMGGKTDDQHGPPLEATVTVLSLPDGKYEETEARHGGQSRFDMGPCAVVRTDAGQTILLTSRRAVPFSLGQITSCGIDPAAFQVIIIKGVHAPVAAYAPVCAELLRVDTPGVTRADMTKLKFAHRRRPLFPFETDFAWSPNE